MNSQQSKVSVHPYAWVILIVIFIVSISAPLCMFKVSPILPILSETFNLSLTVSGLLMSMFSLCGFILALPSSAILQKVGVKWTCVIATAFLFVGSVWGVNAATSTSLLLSRFFEGAGMGFISVAAPVTLAMWFPSERRGMAMAIWSNWMPVGTTLAFAIVPRLVLNSGYRAAWWFTAVFSGIALVLSLIFIRTPGEEASSEDAHAEGGAVPLTEKVSFKKALANKNIWFLTVSIFAFGIGINIIPTYYPIYLTAELGFELTKASNAVSLNSILCIILSPLAGYILDRISTRKYFFTWLFFVLAILFLFPFRVSGTMIYVWIVLFTFCTTLMPTSMFSSAPEVMHSPAESSYAMGMVTMGQNLGMFTGPLMFAALTEARGWVFACYGLITIFLIGGIAGFFVKLPKKRN